MKSLLLCSIIATSFLSVAIVPAHGQAPNRESSFRVQLENPAAWYAWTDSRSELITSAGMQRGGSPTAPALNIYNVVSGQKRSIDIQREFPEAKKIYVESVAAGPSGSVIVACEVESEDRAHAGDHLLLYDQHSTLITNVAALGYDVGAVATDQEGSLYFVGTRDGERSSKESYPLLVEYDSQGRVTLKALPRSLFYAVDDPAGDAIGAPHKGATRLSATEKTIEVYLAPLSELLIVSRQGEIEGRFNVASRLSEFAKGRGYKSVYVDANLFSPSGDLWFVGHLEEPQDGANAARPASNFVVKVTPEGQLQVPYPQVGSEASGHYLPRLIGFTESNEPVAYRYEESSDLIVKRNPY